MRLTGPALRHSSRALGAVAAGVLLAACTASGAGTLPSNDATRKASFGFTFDGTTSSFSGSYHDPRGQILDLGNGTVLATVDVDLKGTGRLHPCTPSDPACAGAPPVKGGCVVGEPAYQSQNRLFPGGGIMFLLVCDGDGVNSTVDDDSIMIDVETGPYTGYQNQGNPSGNTTVKN